MENLRIPLMFEVLRSEPKLLFTVELISTKLKARLENALSYVHTLIEDLYQIPYVREKTLQECKKILT
jgi:hypothetical protein